MSQIIVLLISVFFFFLLFLALRHVVLWYWRINEAMAKFDAIVSSLGRIESAIVRGNEIVVKK